MRLLLSLCSRTEEAPEALIVVDPRIGTIEPVALPDRGMGAFGIGVAGETVYCVIDHGRPAPDEAERSEIVVLDPETFAVRSRYVFRVARDVHSIAAGDGCLYAASTGTDELVELRLHHEGWISEERVAWRPEASGERTDQHHLNAVAVVDGKLFVCGFGRRPSEGSEWKHG